MDNSTQFKCNRVSKYEVNPRELIFHDYMVRPRKVLLDGEKIGDTQLKVPGGTK